MKRILKFFTKLEKKIMRTPVKTIKSGTLVENLLERSRDAIEVEMFVNFKQLFKATNRRRKRKLTVSQKKTIEFLIKQQFQMWKLSKALQMGSYSGPGSLNQGAALAVEPLDVVMKLVTYDTGKIKLHKDLLKKRKKTRKVKRLKKRRKS